MTVIHGNITSIKFFHYPLIIRLTGLFSVLIIGAVFLTFPRFVNERFFQGIEPIPDIVVVIPRTKIEQKLPPPPRPFVPLESEIEDPADNIPLTILTVDGYKPIIDFLPPPKMPEIDFKAWDEPPKPLIPIRPKYPPIAREAGIEGKVIVEAFIDEKGRVREVVIIEGIPNTGLDEAAIEAVRKTRFSPAKQRDRPVAVKIEIPIIFKLR